MGLMQDIKESLKDLRDSWKETTPRNKIFFMLFVIFIIILLISVYIGYKPFIKYILKGQ